MEFDFLPTRVTPDAIVLAARAYIGLKYSASGTWCHERGGRVTGQCDCAGLFLLVARRLDLLPGSFDVNLPPEITGVPRETALREILTRNFVRIEVADLRPGDLLTIQFKNQPADGRHLAVYTSADPAPRGSILHALNDVSGRGRVWEQPIDVGDLARIRKAYRLREEFRG